MHKPSIGDSIWQSGASKKDTHISTLERLQLNENLAIH